MKNIKFCNNLLKIIKVFEKYAVIHEVLQNIRSRKLDINNYSIYSVVSSNGNKNEADMNEVLKKLDAFKALNNANDAKEYLEKTWNLTHDVKRYPLGDSCTVDIKENDKKLFVMFEYEDNITMHYFEK